jgi:hypothetical protein
LRDSLLATFLILANYGFQFAILRDRRWLFVALLLNFGCLAFFKYRVWLANAAGVDIFAHDIVIPLGISLYVFQLSAFMIDLSRGKAQPFFSVSLRSLSCSSASSLLARSCAGGNSDPRCISFSRGRFAFALRRHDLSQRPGERCRR